MIDGDCSSPRDGVVGVVIIKSRWKSRIKLFPNGHCPSSGTELILIYGSGFNPRPVNKSITTWISGLISGGWRGKDTEEQLRREEEEEEEEREKNKFGILLP